MAMRQPIVPPPHSRPRPGAYPGGDAGARVTDWATGAAGATFLPGAPAFAVERAEGVHLITPDGRRILDAAGGAIVANIGHGRPEVAEVAAAAIREIDYVVPPFATAARTHLVERLRSA